MPQLHSDVLSDFLEILRSSNLNLKQPTIPFGAIAYAVFLTPINSYIHMKCIQKTGADKNNSLERKIDLTLYYIIYI